MVDASTIASVGNTTLYIGVMIIVGIILSAILGGMLWGFLRYKRYREFKCIIFEKDGLGQVHQKFDGAGIFTDKKTSNKRFYMKKNKVGLNPDNVPFIKTGNIKSVYLMQNGLKNFHYINMNITDNKYNVTVGEEDVNWAINAYERQKKMFSASLLMQLMPFVALAFVSIIILVIFIYFFKEFATLREFAVVMKETAQILAQSSGGTTVITG